MIGWPLGNEEEGSRPGRTRLQFHPGQVLRLEGTFSCPALRNLSPRFAILQPGCGACPALNCRSLLHQERMKRSREGITEATDILLIRNDTSLVYAASLQKCATTYEVLRMNPDEELCFDIGSCRWSIWYRTKPVPPHQPELPSFSLNVEPPERNLRDGETVRSLVVTT